MGPHGIPEECLIDASLEPVLPRVLPFGPSDREIFETRDSLVYDCTVSHCRADYPKTTARQGANDLLQDLVLDRDFGAKCIYRNWVRRNLQFTE